MAASLAPQGASPSSRISSTVRGWGITRIRVLLASGSGGGGELQQEKEDEEGWGDGRDLLSCVRVRPAPGATAVLFVGLCHEMCREAYWAVRCEIVRGREMDPPRPRVV